MLESFWVAEILVPYLVNLSAGALLEVVKLVKQDRDAEKEEQFAQIVRVERIEDRFGKAINQALRDLAPQLTENVQVGFVGYFSDEVVQAELMKLFLRGAGQDPEQVTAGFLARLDRLQLDDDCRNLAPELIARFTNRLLAEIADDPQLRFLREIGDHQRLADKIDQLAAHTTTFHNTFLRLEHRQTGELHRIALELEQSQQHVKQSAQELDQIRQLLAERLAPPPPPVDYAVAERDYCQFVRNQYGKITLWSVKADHALSADLERIYISLKTQDRQERGAPRQALSGRAQPVAGDEEMAEALAAETSIGIDAALQRHDHLVVVGRPGSGKTTLLKYLALTYARGLAAERLDLNERRLPVYLPLRDFNRFLANLDRKGELVQVGPQHLLDFMSPYVRTLAPKLDLPDKLFEKAVSEGHCVLLLDGVDEVPTNEERIRVAQAVVDFIGHYPQNRFIITSRPHGFSGTPARQLRAACTDCSIEDLSDADIRSFVEAWYEAVLVSELGDTPETLHQAQQRSAHLVKAVNEQPRIRRLASNPLMLSVLGTVHHRNVELPQRRVEVYDECVEFLLGYWDEIRDPQSEAARELARTGGRDRTWKRKFIAPVAFEFHRRNTLTLPLDEITPLLVRRLHRPGIEDVEDEAAKWLRIIQERSGLLQEPSPGQFSFTHPTFQEYLTAWHLAAGLDPFGTIRDHVPDSWWREVILLLSAHLSASSEERAAALMRQILEQETDDPGVRLQNLTLAALCLVDCTQEHAEYELWQDVTNRLVQAVARDAAPVDLKTRIEAGNALGQMGDPRLGQMVNIPAGTFVMGTPKDELDQLWEKYGRKDSWPSREWLDHETPQREVYLDAYAIDRYCVTNAEYKTFVEAEGHRPPLGWHGGHYPSGKANHPVVYVSWHDAQAYAKWAGKRLPTEAEWEKAARGTDGRLWPWGNDWVAGNCNCQESKTDDTTPVGIFPGGGSPFGVQDMAGNVWEWCADRWAEDAYSTASDANPQGPESGEYRVLRGGAFWHGPLGVRCSCRYGTRPASWSLHRGFRCAQ